MKFSKLTLILTEKLQSHFFAVTETLNSDKSDSNQCYSESESAAAHCSHSTVVSTLQPECKSADSKVLFYIHLNDVVLNFKVKFSGHF